MCYMQKTRLGERTQKQINKMIIDVWFDIKKYVMYMFIKVSRLQQRLLILSLFIAFEQGWQKQGTRF